MNHIQIYLRDRYLATAMNEKDGIDFSCQEGLYKLWHWAQNQYWWDNESFHKYLRKNRDHSDPLVNSIYKYLKDKKDV
jgi:hypothetical protein